jgi:hypothetical protein
MNITIQNICLDEDYGKELMPFVPFRSVPVRTKDKKYRTRMLDYEEHPFWAWVSYKEIEPLRINPDRDGFSSIIDVNLYDVDKFVVDLDEIEITFADGTFILLDLSIDRYSHISIEAVY